MMTGLCLISSFGMRAHSVRTQNRFASRRLKNARSAIARIKWCAGTGSMAYAWQATAACFHTCTMLHTCHYAHSSHTDAQSQRAVSLDITTKTVKSRWQSSSMTQFDNRLHARLPICTHAQSNMSRHATSAARRRVFTPHPRIRLRRAISFSFYRYSGRWSVAGKWANEE